MRNFTAINNNNDGDKNGDDGESLALNLTCIVNSVNLSRVINA